MLPYLTISTDDWLSSRPRVMHLAIGDPQSSSSPTGSGISDLSRALVTSRQTMLLPNCFIFGQPNAEASLWIMA